VLQSCTDERRSIWEASSLSRVPSSRGFPSGYRASRPRRASRLIYLHIYTNPLGLPNNTCCRFSDRAN
jgi:hypothetical protein